jgi:ribose 5-phosphate isomerase B
MRVVVAGDDAAAELVATIRSFLRTQEAVPVELVDVDLPPSDPLDAPEIAAAVAVAVPRRAGRPGRPRLRLGGRDDHRREQGPRVRAAQSHDTFTAEHSRTSNDAQILVLGPGRWGRRWPRGSWAPGRRQSSRKPPRRREKMAKLRAIDERFLR